MWSPSRSMSLQVPDPNLKALFDLTPIPAMGSSIGKIAAGGFFTKILPCLAGGDIEIFTGPDRPGYRRICRGHPGGAARSNSDRGQEDRGHGRQGQRVIQDNYFDTMHMAESASSAACRFGRIFHPEPTFFPRHGKRTPNSIVSIKARVAFTDCKKAGHDPYIRLPAPQRKSAPGGKYEGGASFVEYPPGHAPDGKQLFFIERFYGKETEGDWDAIERTVELPKWMPELFETLKPGLCSIPSRTSWR